MTTSSIDISDIRLPKRKLLALFSDAAKCAKAINLSYVSDKQPGIIRQKLADGYKYLMGGRTVKDQNILLRIKRLVIPPAWQNVWISPQENGHLQVTGTDTRNRKQYIYHPSWTAIRAHTKFAHMLEFGQALPAIRARLQKDLRKHGLPQEKVLALAVAVMQRTCIRIGSSIYEQLYGSHGLTTLCKKHISINGNTIQFQFKGKKGISHDINLCDRQLSALVTQMAALKGKYLFQYKDTEGKVRHVDSAMVNSYIREISGGSFTAKDFRTWEGTLQAIAAFREMGPATTEGAIRRNIVAVLDQVAKRLGNTRTVCKKYYVHPLIIEHYSEHTLEKYFKKVRPDTKLSGFSELEYVLMKVLGN